MKQIMNKARSQREIIYAGSSIQLFPDLSWVTLQKRRHLKPLLQLLKDQGISYRWGFPCALMTFKNGRTTTLHSYEDLSAFCAKLDLSSENVPD